MKPNGRRRWRKWLARERKGRMAPSGRGTEPWCWWASCDGTRVVRRHRGGEWVTGSLPDLATMPLPAREFSARSLCGMSETRKRRLFGAAVEALPQGERAANLVKLYRKYRLGERLRPCKGCAECQRCAFCGQLSTCVGLYDPMHVHQKPEPACDNCCGHGCEDGHCDKREPDDKHCDGSGVLPAKRHRRCGWWLQTRTAKNATQRCGMPTTDGWLDCQNCGGSGWLMGRERP